MHFPYCRNENVMPAVGYSAIDSNRAAYLYRCPVAHGLGHCGRAKDGPAGPHANHSAAACVGEQTANIRACLARDSFERLVGAHPQPKEARVH